MITINVITKKKEKGVLVTKDEIKCFRSLDKAKEFIEENRHKNNVTFSGASYDDDTEKGLLVNLGVLEFHDIKREG